MELLYQHKYSRDSFNIVKTKFFMMINVWMYKFNQFNFIITTINNIICDYHFITTSVRIYFSDFFLYVVFSACSIEQRFHSNTLMSLLSLTYIHKKIRLKIPKVTKNDQLLHFALWSIRIC